MIMISIVICLALELFIPHMGQFRSLGWINIYSSYVKKVFGRHEVWSGPWGVIAVLLLPLILLRVLQAGFSQVWLGLFELMFSIAVLVYCLRYQPQDEWVDELVDAVEEDDEERVNTLSEKIVAGPVKKDQDRLCQVSDAILGNINEQIFAVLLWFAFLGPMGALMYRISWYLSEQVDEEWCTPGFKSAANRLYAILNWLPARLLVTGYAIVGSFEDVMLAWRESYQDAPEDMQEVNRLIVVSAGRGAIHFDRFMHLDDDGNESCTVEAVTAARGLILRTMLAWGIVIAIITLAGWAS